MVNRLAAVEFDVYRRGRSRLLSLAARCLSPSLSRHDRPGHVVCLLSERCSSKCVHCDIWRNRGVEVGPTVDEWRLLLDEVRDWLGPTDLVLTGGEALLRPFTLDLVEHATRIGLKVELLTHGYWRDQLLIERLALARPRQVTLSLDGVGQLHDRVRGRTGFFERTAASIDTLIRTRSSHRLDVRILLKTVIMSHNLSGLADVARFARDRGIEVLYQPIEQNYGEEDNAAWIDTSGNWPADTEEAVAALEGLAALKRQGLPIVNSEIDFERMIAYFREPERYRIRVQHHDFSATCGAVRSMQIQANGDVKVCFAAPPIGNFREAQLRRIWRERPEYWISGCCLERRMSPAEAADVTSR